MAKALVPGNLYDDALLVSLSSRGSIRSRSRAWAISVAILSRSSGLLRCPSGHAERKSCPPRCDIILHGSVITARDVPGAMKDRVVQLCGDIGWPETFDKMLQSPGGHGSYEVTNWEPFRRGRHRGHRECHRPGERQRIAVERLESSAAQSRLAR